MKAMTQVQETRTNKTLGQVILSSKAVIAMAALFSTILEEEVTPLRALHLLNAQLSFGLLLVLGGLSPIIAALLLLWFALSLWQCKR